MKIEVLKREKRLDVLKASSYGVQTYGRFNDYPQSVVEILASSVTGTSCVKEYAAFIEGSGFDGELADLRANARQTFNDLLAFASKDFATFGGFALLVNYNANYRISSVHPVPFENVRIALADDNGVVRGYALHPDWGRRNTALKAWSAADIVRVNAFNPAPDIVANEVAMAGGFENYKGQLLYYSNAGEFTYPLPIYDCALTDMNTEEGISNITNRNARNNFLPSGMLVDICQVDQTDDEENATQKLLRQYQGDTNALKMIYAQVASEAEVPRFVEFKTQNFDKEYSESRAAAKDNIGRAFNQPPILRAEQTNAGFSTTEMVSAYNYYNSITGVERAVVERVMQKVVDLWWNACDFVVKIVPLSYEVGETLADRLGGNLSTLLSVVNDANLSEAQKRGVLRSIFQLDEKTINSLLPL